MKKNLVKLNPQESAGVTRRGRGTTCKFMRKCLASPHADERPTCDEIGYLLDTVDSLRARNAKLAEALDWALKKGMYVTLTAPNERCDHCPGTRPRIDWGASAAEESKWMADFSWHKENCPYAYAHGTLKANRRES